MRRVSLASPYLPPGFSGHVMSRNPCRRIQRTLVLLWRGAFSEMEFLLLLARHPSPGRQPCKFSAALPTQHSSTTGRNSAADMSGGLSPVSLCVARFHACLLSFVSFFLRALAVGFVVSCAPLFEIYRLACPYRRRCVRVRACVAIVTSFDTDVIRGDVMLCSYFGEVLGVHP